MSLTALTDAEQMMMQPPAAVQLLECLSASQRSAHEVFLGQKAKYSKGLLGKRALYSSAVHQELPGATVQIKIVQIWRKGME